MITTPPPGYKNRTTHPLPSVSCKMQIIIEGTDGLHEFICIWMPGDKLQYSNYIGTCRVIEG